MSIPLEGRLRWRRTAPFHVQLELEKPQDIERVARDLQVQGRVIRVFRTDGRLGEGDSIAFVLWVCDVGDEPTGPAYIYFDNFAKARYMEVYLHGDPPKCELAAYEFSVIRTPTEEPTLTAHQLEELFGQFSNGPAVPPRIPNAPKWWQFWRR